MSRRTFGTIIQIGDVLVSEDIVREYFACDYEKCRGCCCVIGDSGAPLEEREAELIERHYDEVSPYMTGEGRNAVEKDGFFQIDRDGDMVSPTISSPHLVEGLDCIPGTDGLVGTPGLEDCAFIRYEQGDDGRPVCLCAVEKCFLAGKCTFRKPASCWLYPIRVSRLGNGTSALNLHRWSICSDAFEKGKREGIRAYRFLKEPLTEVFGEDFYEALDTAARHILREEDNQS